MTHIIMYMYKKYNVSENINIMYKNITYMQVLCVYTRFAWEKTRKLTTVQYLNDQTGHVFQNYKQLGLNNKKWRM